MSEVSTEPQAKRPPQDAAVVLFDGDCALCNGTVRELMHLDHHRVLYYAPLQGPTALEVLERHGRAQDALSGMWLAEHWGTGSEKLSHRSDAVLRIADLIAGTFWPERGLHLVPRFLREFAYEVVSRLRYRVFGKATKDACSVASPDERARVMP